MLAIESWMRPVKLRELIRPISGKPWIDVRDEAPVLIESEILILQFVQRGSEQSRYR